MVKVVSLERKKIKIEWETVEVGLRSIERSYMRVVEDAEIFLDALKLRKAGHTDFIDCVLYAISLREDLKFLSFDSELKEFLQRKEFEDTIFSP